MLRECRWNTWRSEITSRSLESAGGRLAQFDWPNWTEAQRHSAKNRPDFSVLVSGQLQIFPICFFCVFKGFKAYFLMFLVRLSCLNTILSFLVFYFHIFKLSLIVIVVRTFFNLLRVVWCLSMHYSSFIKFEKFFQNSNRKINQWHCKVMYQSIKFHMVYIISR